MTESNRKLKVGLIGCGRMGAKTSNRLRMALPPGWLPLNHAEAIGSMRNLELVALCDIDPQKVEWAATTYDVDNCYSDYKALIAEIRPDILSIATRTEGRAEIVKFAVENGIRGIHVEKPFSRNMAECKCALKLVSQKGVRISYGTYRRYMDIYREARRIVESGEIGEPLEIAVDHGKTMLMWNHPHSVDLLMYFSGCLEVEYVQATCLIEPGAVNGPTVDDDPIVENAFIKFNNGVNGLITSASGMNTRISCSQGSLTVGADGSWIDIEKKDKTSNPSCHSTKRFRVSPAMSGTQRAFSEVAGSFSEGAGLSMNWEEIMVGQKLLLGIAYSSVCHGKRTDLSDLDDDFTVTGRCGHLYA